MSKRSALIYVTKLAAAKRQLDAAIRMKFPRRGRASHHTSPYAAYAILRSIKNKWGQTHLTTSKLLEYSILPTSNLRTYFLPYREFCTFCFFILAIDAVSKFLLLPSMQSLNANLGHDWLATLIAQTLGLALLGFLLGYIARPKIDVIAMPCLFLTVVVLASPFVSSFQDFSADGQSYHLGRVALFPVDWNIGNILLATQRGPAISYPLLTDNIRGLQISILGSGPFSGVAVNIAIVACGIYFWVRHCSFLRPALRLIAALSPVAASQLFTYYIDGFIAVFGGMLFLACLLPSVFKDCNGAPANANRRHMHRLIALTLVLSLLVLSQLKYSFAFLFVSFSLPLPLYWTICSVASGSKGVVPVTCKIDSLVLACALAFPLALMLSNPYFLIMKSSISGVDYSYFRLSTLEDMAASAFGPANVAEKLRETPAIFRFLQADILSIWPGGADLVDDDVRSSFLSLI